MISTVNKRKRKKKCQRISFYWRCTIVDKFDSFLFYFRSLTTNHNIPIFIKSLKIIISSCVCLSTKPNKTTRRQTDILLYWIDFWAFSSFFFYRLSYVARQLSTEWMMGSTPRRRRRKKRRRKKKTIINWPFFLRTYNFSTM